MTATNLRSRRALSSSDKTILAVHSIVALAVGIVGLMGATDPGWGDLQRIVVIMLTVVWLAGIVATGLVARFVEHRWVRLGVLLSGPVIALLVIGVAVVR